jgi:transglutaminase-like putative cysteine protease
LPREPRGSADPLAEPTFPHSVLTQTYTLRLTGTDLAPAANEPVQVNAPYTLVSRDEGDTVGFGVGGEKYTVVSYIPAPTVTELREAGTDYPSEVAARYLALPDVPQRVLDLAQELTAQAETPYDKALAIEKHLRSYDYDLEVPPPPPGEDVADYLLFKTRRGYCDYYATAMTVMLRSVGIPARHAVGYVLGTYDFRRDAYRVTQRDAHAWVEVYFAGYGWVEFEPTPYRTIFVRPIGGPTPAMPEVTPGPPGSTLSQRPLSLALVLVIAVLALGGVVWAALALIRSGREISSRRLALQVYGGMVRWADRVHLGPARGDTPLEFSRRLGLALEERGPWAEGAAKEATLIGQTYVEARYAAEPLSARDAGQALTAWEKLRSRLRWLFIWRR